MGKVRIGILGGGGILNAHAPGLAAMKDKCTVVAVAEPVEAKYPHIKGLVGEDIEMYPDYQDLLDQADVDAVEILLPHDLHMPATIASAKAGRHVLTEKVMARNTWECDQMIKACDDAGVSLTVCHDRRYDGEWLALKDVVDSGVMGEIFYWKLDHNQNVFLPEGHWIRDRDALGGGAIMSCLTHQIDALRFYGGEVESVTAMTKLLPDQMVGEAVGAMICKMKSGALAHMSINWRTRSNAAQNGLWYEMVQACGIGGEAYYMNGKGTFVLPHNDEAAKATFEYDYDGGEQEAGFRKIKNTAARGHVRCVTEWVKSLCGDDDAMILTTGRDVRGTVEVAEAAYLSAEQGRTITLPIEPTPWK